MDAVPQPKRCVENLAARWISAVPQLKRRVDKILNAQSSGRSAKLPSREQSAPSQNGVCGRILA
nr:hypothetical protein [uncultured Campylobacter sp.]